ncbi:MAG: SRPBCC family protein [Lentimicrobium sp.]|jgi:ligand-binding SRPBCC domain-containing protein|nr:SRPBCC family protein [Lentimicrobium sp.]
MPVFKTNQLVKIDIERCWEFFSDPKNLVYITPPEMNFKILFPDPMPSMYPGMIISYRISPLIKIRMEWITEITHISKPHYFIDNQLKGPYSLWHHQHHFEVVPEGVMMTDTVTYTLPMGKIGQLIAGWFIRKKIISIFEHRRNVIDKTFI